jgi:hypothetical protein
MIYNDVTAKTEAELKEMVESYGDSHKVLNFDPAFPIGKYKIKLEKKYFGVGEKSATAPKDSKPIAMCFITGVITVRAPSGDYELYNNGTRKVSVTSVDQLLTLGIGDSYDFDVKEFTKEINGEIKKYNRVENLR